MFDFRATKRAARRILHDFLACPAVCFFLPDPTTDPIVITAAPTVRVHDRWLRNGDLKGTSFSYAEMADVSPRIIFMKAEVIPMRNMIVSLEAGLAYRVDNVLPHDDLTITAEVVRLEDNETTGFPVPVSV
jgi:hypothetical protein